jgi:hypothetical protein
MSRNHLIFCVVLVLCPMPAAAAPQLKFRTRHYQVTTDLDREAARQVGEHMDMVFAEYSDRFRSFTAKTPGGQPLFVFEKRQDYLDFLASQGVNGAGSAGMFFVTARGSGLATFLEGQGMEQMLYTLRHEGFHQFAFNRIGPNLPLWVNEGLAEYFASSIIVGRRMRAGQVIPQRLRALQAAIEEDRQLAFRELLTMTSPQWSARVQGGEGGMQYMQSWSMVHFLVHGGPRYPQALEQYLHQVARGVDSDQAFARTFGGDYEAFERKWKEYVAGLEPGPEATAAQRLEFLGRGMAWLYENGKSVESLDQLKEQLQSHDFAVRYGSGHSVTIELRAADDQNFQASPPARKGAVSSIEMVPAKDPRLPPGLRVNGLSVPVRLVWEMSGEDRPISRIIYE